MSKKLYKNRDEAKISGVCAGVSEFFEIDVTLVRVIWLFSILGLGSGLLLYIIMAILLPDKDEIL
ncbi:PspC domain-containing protein [Mycoplasmatota bacterium WC44]